MFKSITQTIAKKYPKLDRYISIPLILIAVLPPIFLIGFGGVIGSWIGLVIFGLIGSLGMFELFSNMNMSKISAIYLSLTIFLLFLLPFQNTKDIVELSNNYSGLLGDIIKKLFSWNTVLFYFLSLFVPIILDPKIRSGGNLLENILIIITAAFITGFFGKGLWAINNYNWVWVFFFLPIAIIADTLGFFGGMLFGKKWFNGAKLAPKLSPKKTWAGFLVGYIGSAAFICIAGWYMHIFAGSNEILFLVISTILIPIISPMGDLLFSGIKRYLNIKDFSNLLPGHGGVFDRIDAMGAVITTFVLLFMIL